MSLTKKPTMTARKIAANRANGSNSRGPRTAQGRERSRAAHLTHGLYSKEQQAALTALGENPEQFAELLEGVCQEFSPTSRLQEMLALRLARALWLMDRTDRSHEGNALGRAQNAEHRRENSVHARMMRLSIMAQSLRWLARGLTREYFVTQPKELELMQSLAQDPEVHDMGDIAVALFCQLRDPGAQDEFGNARSSYEQQRQVLIRVKQIFGLDDESNPDAAPNSGSANGAEQDAQNPDSAGAAPPAPARRPNPYRHITAQMWEAREPVRQLLENILTHQAEFCENQRQVILKDSLAGPSPFERATEISTDYSEELLKRRVQDSNLREVHRLANLLLRMKRAEV